MKQRKEKTMPDYGYFCKGDIIPAGEMKRQFLSKGMKPTTGYVCIRRLAGKQCKIGSPRGGRCECTHPLFDHTELFIKDGKPHTLVTQPYSLRDEELSALLSMCEKFNLKISMDGAAWHFPGRALRVVITQKH